MKSTELPRIPKIEYKQINSTVLQINDISTLKYVEEKN